MKIAPIASLKMLWKAIMAQFLLTGKQVQEKHSQ